MSVKHVVSYTMSSPCNHLQGKYYYFHLINESLRTQNVLTVYHHGNGRQLGYKIGTDWTHSKTKAPF